MTLEKISDKDMRHCHFLKSTCDIGGPPSRTPISVGPYNRAGSGWRAAGRPEEGVSNGCAGGM